MRPIRINIDLATVDADSVFALQTLGGAGNFTLNGADVSDGEWTTPDGFAHGVTFTSTGNISGVNFTITGFADVYRQQPLTEVIAGPNNNTVTTTNLFYHITSIAADDAVGTNNSSGFSDDAVTATIPLDWRNGNCGIFFDVTGTVDYTFQVTADEVFNPDAYPLTYTDSDDANVVNATTSQHSNFFATPLGCRVLINSYSTGAAVNFTIYQRDV